MWINIEHKLPKKYGYYLTYNANHNFVNKLGSHEIYRFYPKKGSFCNWPQDYTVNEEITHWMKLPDPPKEDKE